MDGTTDTAGAGPPIDDGVVPGCDLVDDAARRSECPRRATDRGTVGSNGVSENGRKPVTVGGTSLAGMSKTFSSVEHAVRRHLQCTLDDLRERKRWLDSVERTAKQRGPPDDGDDAAAGGGASRTTTLRRARHVARASHPKLGSPSDKLIRFVGNAFRSGGTRPHRPSEDGDGDTSAAAGGLAECKLFNKLLNRRAKAPADGRRPRHGDRVRPSAAVRKCLSDTDLPRAAAAAAASAAEAADGDRPGRGDERRERFRTAVARLQYVGGAFKGPCRPACLKMLCEVDVLAGSGRSAEAVRLFVSTLTFSDDPELTIRKAEAAYDWRFFCHLFMWRYSYESD